MLLDAENRRLYARRSVCALLRPDIIELQMFLNS